MLFFLNAVRHWFLCSKGSCHLFHRLVDMLSSKPVYFPCFPLYVLCFWFVQMRGTPVVGMIFSVLEILVQSCFRDRLSWAVTHRQLSTSNVTSQFGVTSIPVAGSSAEDAIPSGDRGGHPHSLRALRVAKQGKLGKKLARSYREWQSRLNYHSALKLK